MVRTRRPGGVPMPQDGDTSAWLFVAVAGFVLAFAAIVWLALRQRRSLDAWLEQRIASERWVAEPEHSPVSPERSRWLGILTSVGYGPFSGSGPVGVDRLAVNPGRGALEAAFVLARVGARGRWRLSPRSRWSRQAAGVGVVARLPRRVATAVMFIPQPAAAPGVWQRLTGLELPSVAVDDARMNESWTALSDEPERAAAMLAREEQLRAALVAIAERALGHRWTERRLLGLSMRVGQTPRVSFLVVELAGERAYLFAGPKAVNQEPFPALEEAAQLLAGAVARPAAPEPA